MFKNLFNLGYKRTALQAVGFYLFYFLLLLLSTFVIALVLALITTMFWPQNTGDPEVSKKLYLLGQKAGIVVAILSSAGLSIIILKKKAQLDNPLHIIGMIVFAGLALVGGSVLGLLTPAYFSTLDNKKAVNITV